ncbi:vacuolar protein sorting-associated protein 16 homolog [Thrips palmi]|uniref:Vacuolar protein sorting-associated protein 16 homolog n=1 Tax=Thrips palmi TaxID=161013 RepID=A0A6P8Y6R6_THRPL|nr:vacuolar protein sorting-associated protein 16 homolog [Thrips palmi]
MPILLTADWCPVGRDEYYRKFEVYNMEWTNSFNMENVIVASCSYGGPLAVRRDPKKIVKVQGSGKPTIYIYTAAGELVSSIVLSRPVIHVGWSIADDLLCIEDDGSVLRYDLFGNHQHTFSVCEEAKITKVIEANVFNSSVGGTGVAILTSSYRFFLVNNVKDPKTHPMPEIPGLNAPPSSWAVIAKDKQAKILVAKERELYFLSYNEEHPVHVVLSFADRLSSVVEMAVSVDNRRIGLFTDKGRLWIGSSDLSGKGCEIDTSHACRPFQLAWCGSDGVVGVWDGTLLLVTVNGDILTYPCDSRVHVVPEIDCVRVISTLTHEILQSVPSVVQKILRINSVDPGNYLLEASRQFQRRSHSADEYIRLVKDQLPIAVANCIEAAGYEFSPENQKMFIRAAQFGKGFVPNLDPEPYVTMCRVLRVLNAVRNFKVCLPITNVQYIKMSESGLLDRLIRRRHYYMAIQICKHLKLPPAKGLSRILAEWAFYKVSQAKQDREQVAKEIADKLGKAPGISFKDIALRANNFGHTQLAIRLMDYEPRAREQVPLLLNLGQEVPALLKAMESGDTDLVYTVLLRMHAKMPLADFYLKMRNYPLAHSLYIKYSYENNNKELHDIYSQESDFNAQAALHLKEAYLPKNSGTRETSLAAARQSYKNARNEFLAVACDEQLKLLKFQRDLEAKFRREFFGRSLHDTVEILLSLKELKLADSLRAEFKVPDRRYWWLRILAHAQNDEWEQLEKFSKDKKSPIGYEPFVDVCLEKNKKLEAQKYMSRVKDDLKVKYYAKIGMLEKAAQTAFEQKDVQALNVVQARCGAQDRHVVEQINTYLAQLRSKK